MVGFSSEKKMTNQGIFPDFNKLPSAHMIVLDY